MSIYVVDSANPLPPTDGENETGLLLADGDRVFLAYRSEIVVNGLNSWGIFGGSSTLLAIDGRVSSAGETAFAVNGVIAIGYTGVVEGQDYGVQLLSSTTADPSTLINAGF